jgi:hypothetical protein
MFKLIGMIVAISILAFTQASAANSPGAKACLDKCREDLQRAGTWKSYPKGYCKNKCGYEGRG